MSDGTTSPLPTTMSLNLVTKLELGAKVPLFALFVFLVTFSDPCFFPYIFLSSKFLMYGDMSGIISVSKISVFIQKLFL